MFQGKRLTRGSDLVWVAEPGTYYINQYQAQQFNQKVRFTGTPGSPSTVWIRGDANLGFGAELHFENTNVFSRGAFRHNGGGNPNDFGDGDITFSNIQISGTSQLVIGDGDLNLTQNRGLSVGGSSRITIGNGDKRINGDIQIGGQAELTMGSGDLHVLGDFNPDGSSTFILNTPSTGTSNVFIDGDYVGGASGDNVLTDANFYIDGDFILRPALTVTSTNVQYFASGDFNIAAGRGSIFNTPMFDRMLNAQCSMLIRSCSQAHQQEHKQLEPVEILRLVALFIFQTPTLI